MRGPRLALAALLLTVLLVGTQLAFTAVGREVDPGWSDPVEVATLDADADTLIAEVAASGGSGGGVAWIEQDDDRWTVRAARLSVTDGSVSVTDRTVLGRAGHELAGLDVAYRDGTVVATWEHRPRDDVVLARWDDGVARRVVSDDPFRVRGASVALGPEGALVAYSAAAAAEEPFAVRLARVDGGTVTRTRVGGPTHRRHSPVVATAGERVSVTWFDPENDTVRVTTGALSDGLRVGPTVTAGEAHVKGTFGGGGPEVPAVASAAAAKGMAPVWTDAGDLATATVTDASATAPRVVGTGGDPAVAARGDRTAFAWVRAARATKGDIYYRSGGGTTALARLPTEEGDPAPMYAPDPAVAWLDWGGENRVLVTAREPAAGSGPAARLGAAPERFLFLSVSAATLGAVTVLIMPWTYIGLFGAFVVTTGVVSSRVLGAGAWVAERVGHATDSTALRRRLQSAPAAAWVTAFALVEIPVVVHVVRTTPQLRAVGFAHPLGASLGGLAVAVAVVAAAGVRSNWRAVAVFIYLQNAALWAISVTAFL